jgi:hypothetical protein
MKNKIAATTADKTDPRKSKATERFNEEISVTQLESALEVIWRELQSERNLSGPYRDEGEAAVAFAAAATELLNAVDDTLFRIRQSRDETRALLDRLEIRLTSTHG